jgi:hypothetical protein
MILRFTHLAFILFFSATLAHGQSFEGKIAYQTSYKSKIPNVTDEQFTGMMGTNQEYLFKDGNYKSITNGSLVQWQLYINKDNKLYTKMSSAPAILWNDGATNPDKVIKAEVNKNVITIAGYQCDELILTCESGIQKYYYNGKLKADAKLFENHKFANFYEVISRTNAVPLKMVIETAQFSLESVATDIKAMKLEESEFLLPANSQLMKSPY